MILQITWCWVIEITTFNPNLEFWQFQKVSNSFFKNSKKNSDERKFWFWDNEIHSQGYNEFKWPSARALLILQFPSIFLKTSQWPIEGLSRKAYKRKMKVWKWAVVKIWLPKWTALQAKVAGPDPTNMTATLLHVDLGILSYPKLILS